MLGIVRIFSVSPLIVNLASGGARARCSKVQSWFVLLLCYEWLKTNVSGHLLFFNQSKIPFISY